MVLSNQKARTIKGVHAFPKGICLKVSVIERLKFELAYYDSAGQCFKRYTTWTPFTKECTNQILYYRYIALRFQLLIAQSAVAVEYTDCLFAEGQDPHNEYPGYDTKQFDGEVPGMLEIWGLRGAPSLPSLQGPLWPDVVAPNRVLSMSHIELNCELTLNWIVWNRTVWLNSIPWNRNVFEIKLWTYI